MGKLTISMAIFNSKLLVYQRLWGSMPRNPGMELPLTSYSNMFTRGTGFWGFDPSPYYMIYCPSLEMATLLFSIFELSNIDWHFLRCVVQRPTQLILWDGWLCRTHAFQSFVCCFSRIQFPSPYNIILPHFGGGLPHVRPGRENAWQACRGATVKNPSFQFSVWPWK